MKVSWNEVSIEIITHFFKHVGFNQHHQIFSFVIDNNEGYESDIEKIEKVKQIMDTKIEFSDFVNCEYYLQISTMPNIDDII